MALPRHDDSHAICPTMPPRRVRPVTRSCDLDQRLQAAAHRLCLVGGLRAVSFRGIAREADLSAGMLGHRFGSIDGLIRHLIALEIQACDCRLTAWQRRLGGGERVGKDPQPLTDILLEVLEDEINNARPSAMFQAELLVAPGLEEAARPLGAAYRRLWELLSAAHLPAPAPALAPMLAGLMADERAFALAFGATPAYRLLRRATISHLLGHFPPTEPAILPGLLSELQALSITAGPPPVAPRAALLSPVIADILEADGAAAVSHRAVAGRAGVPNSTVAHHFRTTEQLIEAGMASLYERIRKPAPEADGGNTILNRIGRATHGMALAAARDGRYRPYAIDMRWRRGENLRPNLPAYAGLPEGQPATLTAQAMSMAMIGQSLLAGACGASDPAIAARTLECLRPAVKIFRTVVP